LLTSTVSAATVVRTVADLFNRVIGGLRDRSRDFASGVAREREYAQEDAYATASFYEEPEGEPQVSALLEEEDPGPTAFAAEAEAIEATEQDPLEQVEQQVIAATGEPDEPTAELELTPMGSRRSSVTESEELDYKLPQTSMLRRSTGAQAPDASNQEAVAKLLVETL